MSPMADLFESWLARLDPRGGTPGGCRHPRRGADRGDPTTGEQWEAGQVWGHIAEFIQFWVEQAGDVIDAYQGEPVPFGRIRSDPTRLAGIEQGRHAAIETMWQEVQADLGDLRRFLAALPGALVGFSRPPFNSRALPTDRIIETFLIDHLEEHAAQLEGLAKSQAPDEG